MFSNSLIMAGSQLILIKFVAIYLILIGLTMIPGWIAAITTEKNIKSYFSFICYSLEQSCNSINELNKVVVTYNKVKFIENNKYPDNNTFIYISKNEGGQHDRDEPNIIFKDENLSPKIEISKISKLNPETKIVISTTYHEILNNIQAKDLKTFYVFTLKKSFNPLLMVKPRLSLLILLFILAALLTTLWVTLRAYFVQKKQFRINVLKLETVHSVKAANLCFSSITLDNIYEDLNHVFCSEDFEYNVLRASLKQKMEHLKEALGRIIAFGTLKRDYSKIELTEEINTATNYFLEQISTNKILIIKNNFQDNVYVEQTKSKNLRIICSIIHHFIINSPPKGQLTITIEVKHKNSIKVIFCDQMPLAWKLFEHENSALKNHLLFTFDKLMYACIDEEIKVLQGNDNSGNYFTLEYKQNRKRHDFNVIQGNFK